MSPRACLWWYVAARVTAHGLGTFYECNAPLYAVCAARARRAELMFSHRMRALTEHAPVPKVYPSYSLLCSSRRVVYDPYSTPPIIPPARTARYHIIAPLLSAPIPSLRFARRTPLPDRNRNRTCTGALVHRVRPRSVYPDRGGQLDVVRYT